METGFRGPALSPAAHTTAATKKMRRQATDLLKRLQTILLRQVAEVRVVHTGAEDEVNSLLRGT